MKEIIYEKDSPQGKLKGILRVIKEDLYFKVSNNDYARQIVDQLKAKGAVIQESTRGWIKVNMFYGKNTTVFKLGDREFDLEDVTDEEIENILAEFYTFNFTKAGFACVVK